MRTRYAINNANAYHEDQLIFILMSYKYRVNHLQKVIANPIFDCPVHIKKVRNEASQILRQLNQLGWHVPKLTKTT